MTMLESLKFGDIFKYFDNEYVFLVGTDEGIIYAAKILTIKDSEYVEGVCNRILGGPKAYRVRDKILFCYVKLTSEGLKNRLAHFKQSARDENRITVYDTGVSLNKEDKQKIKKEVIDPDTPLDKILKDLVSELDI